MGKARLQSVKKKLKRKKFPIGRYSLGRKNPFTTTGSKSKDYLRDVFGRYT